MHNLLKVLAGFKYSPRSWAYARIITGIFWLVFIIVDIRALHPEPCDIGICHFFNCLFFTTQPVSYLVIGISVLLTGMYLFEKRMVLTTFLMSLTGCIVFSVATANGNDMRMEVVTIVLIAQCIAFIQYRYAGSAFKDATPARNLAMLYSIQVVAACYVIAAISKLHITGIGWVAQAPNIAIRVIKASSSRALDYNFPAVMHTGQRVAEAIIRHPFIIQMAFGFSLVVEFFAFSALASRSFCRKYSYLILIMHLFILLFMDILIPAFVVMVIAYMLNLPLDSTSAENKKGGPAYNFSAIIYSFYLGAVFIVLSLIIGEQHPFATFPMFSNMRNTCAYFYLTDQNNKVISPVKYLGLRTDQIEKIMVARAHAARITISGNQGLGQLATPWLTNAVIARKRFLMQKDISQLKLVHHQLWLDNGIITTSDSTIAIVPVASM
jgi:hypothetical protein